MSKGEIILELYLVRHGESMSNAGKVDELEDNLKGDPPLSEKGLKQAELLGEHFSDLCFDAILSSGLRRAIQTADAVLTHQPEKGVKKVEVHKLFTECDTGRNTVGRTVNELKTEFANITNAEGTSADDCAIHYFNHESDEVLLERGKQAMDYILGRFHRGEKVLIAAHAAINTFIMFAALGLSYEQKFDPDFFNTGITKIVFYKEGTGHIADVILKYQNATPHLYNHFDDIKY